MYSKEKESVAFTQQWEKFIEVEEKHLEEDEIRIMKKMFTRKWLKASSSRTSVNDHLEYLAQNKIISIIF